MILAIVANGAPVTLPIPRDDWNVSEYGATTAYDLVDWEQPRQSATHLTIEGSFDLDAGLRPNAVSQKDLVEWGDNLPRASAEGMMDVNF